MNVGEIDTFVLLRPMFTMLFVFSLIILILLIVPKTKYYMNGLMVIGSSVMLSVIAAQLLWTEGVLADELGIASDVISILLFAAILGLAILSCILFYVQKKKVTDRK
ncbi:hypothetical protein [Ornithinibacillus bavariensis]|uniref:Uncharacterized protein n=1 Tax=Ornithinibacillus bavariensis TaxID=545502 RepID=A0A920C745_9BACI|nr:hypothetical protein [Ornithinibacillus bavariensis]GIO26784.1 hypothetical protein J43TS3_13950 [Ornithinibacillus bavariensis]